METTTHTLKHGDTVSIKAAPGTSHLVNLIIADGTSIDMTITANTPCTVVCGRLGMEININAAPDTGIDIDHIPDSNVHDR